MMIGQLAEIFVNVIAPVFALVLIGYVAGPRLQLEARTLTRTAYYLFIPAFVFGVMSTAVIEADLVLRMVVLATAVHLAVGLLAYGVARLLRRPREVVGAYVMIAVFGNVGNFGLPLIQFRLGEEAVVYATFYFLIIIVIAFVICVTVAAWAKGQGKRAVLEVFKTPALLALPPALLFNGLDVQPPLFLSRTVGLLGAAMVPTMLVALGVQLGEMARFHISRDVVLASLLRLVGAAGLAFLLAALLGLTGLARGAGIFQASMPTAVLASIIALEYGVQPDMVTTAVLFTTVISVITLPIIMILV
jgi:predicted permease